MNRLPGGSHIEHSDVIQIMPDSDFSCDPLTLLVMSLHSSTNLIFAPLLLALLCSPLLLACYLYLALSRSFALSLSLYFFLTDRSILFLYRLCLQRLSHSIYVYVAVAETLRQAYPTLLEWAGVGSIPVNSDAQNVPSFRCWRVK
jgi:hypothetical protein